MNRMRSRNLSAAVALLLLAGLPLAGCYTRITRATGPGADRYKVYERNTDNIVMGKWFGEGPKDAPNYSND